MRKLLALALLLLASAASAVDPAWTQSYLFNQSPEANGFTRILYDYGAGGPVVTENSSGPPANRNLQINSNNGDAVFVTSNVPSLDPTVGATVEWRVAVSGAGDAGAELTFLNRFVGVAVYETGVWLTYSSGAGTAQQFASTGSNASQTLWRLTFDPSSQVRLYRGGTLVLGPYTTTEHVKPYQRVLFWGESGGTQTYQVMRWYNGGAVQP